MSGKREKKIRKTISKMLKVDLEALMAQVQRQPLRDRLGVAFRIIFKLQKVSKKTDALSQH